MNDDRIWDFEKSLWTATDEEYRSKIARDAVMVVPDEPFIIAGHKAADMMAQTPRWDDVQFTETKVARPEGPMGGLIVIAYKVDAKRSDKAYTAYCTSTLQRQGEEDWVVIQHQQTPPLASKG